MQTVFGSAEDRLSGKESAGDSLTCAAGLVLSGGGSRGVAHVGVLRALGEHGIEVDCIAGTSSGAIVGALHAAGYSPREMVEFFEKKNPFRLSKLSLGKPGFFDTAKVVEDFEEYFPDNSFEALDKKLFLTATDILHGDLVIFDSGPLIPAILASSSVPLVFTPTEIDGRWFSDGGILDNFPLEPLEGRCSTLIGVYASPLRRVEEDDLTTSLAVSQRAFEVGMYYVSRVKFDRCDVLISPEELSRYGTFDSKHLDEIESIGYEACCRRIEEIRSAIRRKRSVKS